MYRNNNQTNIMKNSPSSSYQNRFSSANFFASMLRRLLFCSNSLPQTFDADDFKPTSSPCLVARLMGLDSLPPPPLHSRSSPTSITKSWSMNSLEFRTLTESDSTQGTLQTSFSFREEPNYVELEDDHFFILSFEKKLFRSKLGYGKLKPSNGERWKIHPNNKENKNSHEHPYKSKGEAESNSENWSPVSVLDADELTTTTSSDLSTPVNEREELESIRKVAKNFKLLTTSPRINVLIKSLHNSKKGRKPNSNSKSKWCKKKRKKMWNEIGRISEEEMAKSRWDYGEVSNLQEIEEIGDYIAGILLRDLLQEMN